MFVAAGVRDGVAVVLAGLPVQGSRRVRLEPVRAVFVTVRCKLCATRTTWLRDVPDSTHKCRL